MKRFTFLATLVAVVGAASVTYAFSNKNKGLTDLQITAIEVLSDTEGVKEGDKGSGLCYKDIHTEDGSLVLYCGSCTYLSGTHDTFAGTGTCF